LYDVVWVVDEDFFRKVLEDGWEGGRDHQLGGGEDAHLTDVCHLLLLFFNYKLKTHSLKIKGRQLHTFGTTDLLLLSTFGRMFKILFL
jgi:hypothetical protein